MAAPGPRVAAGLPTDLSPTATGMVSAVQESVVPACARSITLLKNGVLSLSNEAATTLAANAVFKSACTEAAQPAIIANGGVSQDEESPNPTPNFSSLQDPFYATIVPQVYALAATTVIAYLLVIMLIIAPRSFLDGGVVVLGRRGFTNGPSNGVSIGGRPWLQKVAALTVAVSLTIATADTFRVAERQYQWGIQNASDIQEEVLVGTQLKVIRLVSDVVLWLAQAQTLIRLFPRQREKIVIKWTAFSLITLDAIFGALDSFRFPGPGNNRPTTFTDAIPALSYLFQLSLGLLYAAWVIYYALMKKRYAFYHPLMKNVSLVAILSIVSILVPVVFFILDISRPDLAGWGDYVRWVGAAAASVVVWEWVERIEALEREEKKDGVLGREVFDGDEMMDVSPDFSWPRRRRKTRRKGGGDDGGEDGYGGPKNGLSLGGRTNLWPAMSSIASRYRPRGGGGYTEDKEQTPNSHQALSTGRSANRFLHPPLWPSRPRPTLPPPSRADTESADSTVYAVRYQAATDSASRATEDLRLRERPSSRSSRSPSPSSWTDPNADQGGQASQSPSRTPSPVRSDSETAEAGHAGWRSLAQYIPLRQRKPGLPAEVLPHASQPAPPRRQDDSIGKWDIRGRLEDFAATQAEKIRERLQPTPDMENLPVTVIPAPPRRGAALAQVLEEESSTAVDPNPASQTAMASPTTLAPPPPGLLMRTESTMTRETAPRAAPLPLSLQRSNGTTDPSWPATSPSYPDDVPLVGRPDGGGGAYPARTPRWAGEAGGPVSPRTAADRRPVDEILSQEPPSPAP